MAWFDLKPLPYNWEALEPFMSRRTFEIHWGKLHRAYFAGMNAHIAGTPLALDLSGKSLEDAVLRTYNKGNPHPAFNYAAQAWNHEFFWESMEPFRATKFSVKPVLKDPPEEVLQLIKRDFGSLEKFVQKFSAEADGIFASGWVWLAYKDNKLEVLKTADAMTPLVLGYKPLLALDLWEHAYFLDHQDRISDYISTFFEKLVSWKAVAGRLKALK